MRPRQPRGHAFHGGRGDVRMMWGGVSMLPTVALVVLVAMVAACGGDGSKEGDAVPSATDTAVASATSPAGTEPVGTATQTTTSGATGGETPAATATTPPQPLQFTPGRNDYTIMVDGKAREFIVHVPASYVAGTPAALVFMFHGTSQDGEKFWSDSGWKEKGEAENIITVYPTALRYFVTDDNRVVTKWTYSEIATILKPGTEVHDDVEFVQAMLDRIEATWTIDPERIYATGFSNGGSFTTTRVMMEMADVFAAFGVAGSGVLTPTYQVTPSDETAERSLYILLGTNDDKVFGNSTAIASGITDDFPTTAEEFLAHPYIQAIFGRWFAVLGLETTYTAELGRPARETLTFDTSLAGAPNELRIRVVKDMFHIYPGPSDVGIGFQACDLFWDFFEQHPLGE